MARIFITGSTDGIGLAAAKLLASQGHKVTLHARNAARADSARAAVPSAENVLIGDLSSLESTKALAAAATAAGPWDAVVHNAGLGPGNQGERTADGTLPALVQVNVVAPYVLTSLMDKPKRLLYLSSSMHKQARGDLSDLAWKGKAWDGYSAYCESKFHDILLANVVARAWPDVQSCSLDPGWIQTKMGGAGAPNTVDAPAKATADFAAGKSPQVGTTTGAYFTPSGAQTPLKAATDAAKQDEFLQILEQLSGGVKLPK